MLQLENYSGKVYSFETDKVLYLKSEDKYVTVKQKDREDYIESSLTRIQPTLDESDFTSIHRNCIVNLGHISQQRTTTIDGNTVMTLKMSNGDVLDVSRRNHSKMNKIFKEKA